MASAGMSCSCRDNAPDVRSNSCYEHESFAGDYS